MDDIEFSHHVNYEKNDFASWIEHVFELPSLANSLTQTTSKEGTLDILRSYINGEENTEEFVELKTEDPVKVTEESKQEIDSTPSDEIVHEVAQDHPKEHTEPSQDTHSHVHQSHSHQQHVHPSPKAAEQTVSVSKKPALLTSVFQKVKPLLPQNLDSVFLFLEGLVVGVIITYIVFKFIL